MFNGYVLFFPEISISLQSNGTVLQKTPCKECDTCATNSPWKSSCLRVPRQITARSMSERKLLSQSNYHPNLPTLLFLPSRNSGSFALPRKYFANILNEITVPIQLPSSDFVQISISAQHGQWIRLLARKYFADILNKSFQSCFILKFKKYLKMVLRNKSGFSIYSNLLYPCSYCILFPASVKIPISISLTKIMVLTAVYRNKIVNFPEIDRYSTYWNIISCDGWVFLYITILFFWKILYYSLLRL